METFPISVFEKERDKMLKELEKESEDAKQKSKLAEKEAATAEKVFSEAKVALEKDRNQTITEMAKRRAELLKQRQGETMSPAAAVVAQIPSAEYDQRVRTPDMIVAEVEEAISREFGERCRFIRGKARQVFGLEMDFLEKKHSALYLQAIPGNNAVKELKCRLVVEERKASTPDSPFSQMQAACNKLGGLKNLTGNPLPKIGHIWDNLTLEQVEQLVLDPMMPDCLLSQLEKIVGQLKAKNVTSNISIRATYKNGPAGEALTCHVAGSNITTNDDFTQSQQDALTMR